MLVNIANLWIFRSQFADYSYSLPNPLIICGLRWQFMDSPDSYGFHDSSSLLEIFITFCLWIPQILPVPQIMLRIPQICLFFE